MCKYEALPLQIIISLPILMSLSKLRITLNLYVLFHIIRKIYWLALYLYNLYIEPDCLALSQLRTRARSFCTLSNKFFERRRLVDAPVTNNSDYLQLALIISKFRVPPTFMPLRIYSR
jgi:hypothetical protein